MPRIVISLVVSAALVVAGCSSGSLQAVQVKGGGLCESYVATAAIASPGPQRESWFDRAIKTCSTLDQWQRAVTTYAASVVAAAPTDYLAGRCTDGTAKLGGYQLCGLLAISLQTPTPKPTAKGGKHKPRKAAKPTPTPRPSRAPVVVPASPPPAVSGGAPVPPPALSGGAPVPPASVAPGRSGS